MKWFRSNLKSGSRLALFALAIQFVLSFGHFHAGAQAASVKTTGFAATHLHTLDSLTHAKAAGLIRFKASGDVPAGQPSDDCAICAVMALANALVDAVPPCLPGPLAVAFYYLAADTAFIDPNPARGAFQPRAPPIS
jgi:hypothetical protein